MTAPAEPTVSKPGPRRSAATRRAFLVAVPALVALVIVAHPPDPATATDLGAQTDRYIWIHVGLLFLLPLLGIVVWSPWRQRRRRLRADVRPGPRAWRGATTGTVAAVTVGLAAGGSVLRSGRGLPADAFLAIVLGWIAVALLAGVLLLVARALRGIPPRLCALAVAAVAVLSVFLLLVSPAVPLVVAVFLVGGALAGAGVASVQRPSPRRRRVVAVAGLLAGLAGLAAVPLWLAWGGGESAAERLVPTGTHGFTTLTYGSGDHPRRAEFAADVDVVTAAVDGTAFLAGWDGWRGWLRSRYWGFGPDRLPLNARVWLPDSGEAGPLVLVVHGNHPMEAPSDEGYAWLAEELASHGYVVASVDQNFLNLSVTRGFDFLGAENDARAWLLLEHLRLWRAWQDDPASALYGRADLDRIALIGHSRGGEAVAHAVLFNRLERFPEDATVSFDAGFGIDAVIAIAPTSDMYEPAGRPTPLHDVSYLTLHGGRDGDVAAFDGLRQYERTTFSGNRFAAKAAVYLEDANHGQFNTVWGRRDAPGIAGRTMDTAALVPGETQRRDARTAVLGFLDAVLGDDDSGLAALHDSSHPDWTAATRVIARSADSTETLIAGFDEDTDPATGTLEGTRLTGAGLAVWREEPMPLRGGEQGANGVVLGWDDTGSDGSDHPSSFTVELPEEVALASDPVLSIDVADPGDTVPEFDRAGEPADFTVEIVDVDGEVERTTFSAHGEIRQAPQPGRFKAPLPDWVPATEAVSQTVRIPFATAEPTEVRVVFDRTRTGVVRIDRIAFGSLSSPSAAEG